MRTGVQGAVFQPVGFSQQGIEDGGFFDVGKSDAEMRSQAAVRCTEQECFDAFGGGRLLQAVLWCISKDRLKAPGMASRAGPEGSWLPA